MNTALEKAHAARKAMTEAGVKVEILNPIQKAARNPQSLLAALKATCYECVGRCEGARSEIATCSSYSCSLWPHRPYQNSAPAGFGLEKRAAAIAELKRQSKGNNPLVAAATDPKQSKKKAAIAYCYDCMGGNNCDTGAPQNLRDLIATCKANFPEARDSTDNPYCGCPLWPHRRWKTISPKKLEKSIEEVAV